MKVRHYLVASALLMAPLSWADYRADLLKASDLKASGQYVRERFLKAMKKPFDQQNNKPKLLLIGDSHAQDFYNALLESGKLANYQIRTRYIPTKCQLYHGSEDISAFRPAKHRKLCADSDQLPAMKAQVAEADVVIIASKWELWAAQRLRQSLKALALKANQPMIIIGRKSFGQIKIRQYLKQPAETLRELRNQPDEFQQPVNQLMKKQWPAAQFVDSQHWLCDGQKTCPIFTDQLQLISFDGGHLTHAGAKWAANRWFNAPQLKALIK